MRYLESTLSSPFLLAFDDSLIMASLCLSPFSLLRFREGLEMRGGRKRERENEV